MLPGKVIRWTFTDGPGAGSYEHTFGDHGTVVWRALDGPFAGAAAEEKEYAGFRVSDDVYTVSYLAKSGHTLTVVFNLKDQRMVGFASNDTQWFALQGTVDSVQ